MILLSLILVALGQPNFSWWASLLTALGGYALFWHALLKIEKRSHRFWIATGWFTLVQMWQLSWMISHPYGYIYGIWMLFAFALGLQFGLVSLLVTREKKLSQALLVAASWTLMEWSRLFLMSGFSFNPAGLALSAPLYSRQLAAVVGVFGLSFWVILTNQLALKRSLLWIPVAILPFIAGFFHVQVHSPDKAETLPVTLVQTGFPVEESIAFHDAESFTRFVFDEWRRILMLLKDESKTSLVVLPEGTVPFGAYNLAYKYDDAIALIKEVWGEEALAFLPPQEPPYAALYEKSWLVTNAFFAQTISNRLGSELVIGLEDDNYSSAIRFKPNNPHQERYAKRILIPLGEYIPSDFFRKLAANYGIHGSFKAGEEAIVFDGPVPYGCSICYEETFGHLTRENKQKGAKLLVNLTNDGWYPDRLPEQHLELARLRTVENGIPLVRACNTGITCALDSLGRTVAAIEGHGPGVLSTAVPLYSYPTLYSRWGDSFIIAFCFVCLVCRKRAKYRTIM